MVMGGSAVGSVLGIAGGAIGGGMVGHRSKNISDRELRNGTLSMDYNQLEQILLPYDQLVKMGLVQDIPGSYGATHPNESRFSRALSGYESDLASADPILAKYQKTVQSGLEGLDSGIPDDLRRSITESLRSSQSSRGIDLTSNTAAIAEVTRLMGGEQAIRSQRLNEANNYFSTVTQGGINALLPQLSQLYGGELQRAIAGSQGALRAGEIGAGIYGSTAS